MPIVYNSSHGEQLKRLYSLKAARSAVVRAARLVLLIVTRGSVTDSPTLTRSGTPLCAPDRDGTDDVIRGSLWHLPTCSGTMGTCIMYPYKVSIQELICKYCLYPQSAMVCKHTWEPILHAWLIWYFRPHLRATIR